MCNNTRWIKRCIQGWVPRLRELAPTARGSREAGVTQPRDHLLADPCIYGSSSSAQRCAFLFNTRPYFDQRFYFDYQSWLSWSRWKLLGNGVTHVAGAVGRPRLNMKFDLKVLNAGLAFSSVADGSQMICDSRFCVYVADLLVNVGKFW